ncbi:SUMO-specific isopeptidase USPL1 isoform X2 [Thalassophryne amazonica]|uniref:SUMO-specific isopeptidase USPL1 isoform X2 n=1 Tax=Thalassophryne amazonica TaxID=390379 RepID=UPI0014710CAA|nr:SUMO-specific isopeptidase USPL1 isoform X2 [Thalassophryne amazonica]
MDTDYTDQPLRDRNNVKLSVQERAASLEYCPWCTKKGLNSALRSYHINIQESIVLCTNPECLFPLVSRSLEDIFASLRPAEPNTGNKRKRTVTLQKEDLVKPSPKRLCSNENNSFGLQSVTDTLTSPAEQRTINAANNDCLTAAKTQGSETTHWNKDFNYSVVETPGCKSLKDQDVVLQKEPGSAACVNGCVPVTEVASPEHLQCSSEILTIDEDKTELSPHHNVPEAEDIHRQAKSTLDCLPNISPLDSQQSGFASIDSHLSEIDALKLQDTEQPTKTDHKTSTADVFSEAGVLSSTTVTESDQLVPVPDVLFWRNTDNLCWLDTLLVALMNCKSLRKLKPKEEPQQSSVWQLFTMYDDAWMTIQEHQQTGGDGVVSVPNHVLQKTNTDLHSLRMSAFKLLQPKLRCKLGQRETPVFAMPLLVKMDSWLEPLFQFTFQWELICTGCNVITKTRFTKTLPTFTNIANDWHPLCAVHFASCNVCRKRKQRRMMVLESVPPVFALHFVEGLPDNDVRMYSFSFDGKSYSITIIIQFIKSLKHFVTWICKADGSWMEFDDLKHPHCKIHPKLPIPAHEIHVVFWEVQEDEEPSCFSTPATCAKSSSSTSEMNCNVTEEVELLPCTPDKSLLISKNDLDIDCSLPESGDGSSVLETTDTVCLDTSIGYTTLLDTFEGLTHNDIITLTLVDCTADSEVQPLNNVCEYSHDSDLPSRNEVLDCSTAPDSSSTVIANEMQDKADVALPMPSNSSDSEAGKDLSSEPTFVPHPTRGRGRGRGRGRSKGKPGGRQKRIMVAPSEAAPHDSPHLSMEHSEIISNEPESDVQDVDPPAETTPVTCADTSPPRTYQNSPAVQNARWTFLLSKHPLTQVHNYASEISPTQMSNCAGQLNPTSPIQYNQIPMRRQRNPVGLVPKLQLRTEESEELPMKAAEKYNAFGAKNSKTQSPLKSPASVSYPSCDPKPFQVVTSDSQESTLNTTMVSNTSLPSFGIPDSGEISYSKKHSSHSFKLMPGLTDTEALRYKLLKKLKAKKKKLAKLNELLKHQGGASLRPDSTEQSSPYNVSSSTSAHSPSEGFFSNLVSPATTASNLSPDSTGLLEMLVSRQDGVDRLDCGLNSTGGLSQVNAIGNGSVTTHTENFLEDFIAEAAVQQPTEMDTEALSGLDIFF